ncbi:MAG: hypothetical protein ACREM3_09720 [Candidatus Rokuibacteriota bacterium]
MPPPASDDADELHAVPLRDFVRARKALGDRLRRQGRAGEAAEVDRLRKPSPALWAVNHLARRHQDLVRRLVDAVERLKRAQLGKPGEMAAATRDQRSALDALTARAEEVLQDADAKATPGVLRLISSSLVGAAADRELRRQLLAGRLGEELRATGFDVFGGARASVSLPPAPARTPPRAAPARESRAGPSAKQLRSRLRAAEGEARTQARRARGLERRAAKLEWAAAQAEAGRDRARRALQTAEDRATKARAAAARARQAATEASIETGRADTRVREARAALPGSLSSSGTGH